VSTPDSDTIDALLTHYAIKSVQDRERAAAQRQASTAAELARAARRQRFATLRPVDQHRERLALLEELYQTLRSVRAASVRMHRVRPLIEALEDLDAIGLA
jgi:hypothetical protein